MAVRYLDDAQRIQAAVAAILKRHITLEEAEEAWEDYSTEYYCAGHLMIHSHSDQAIAEAVEEFLPDTQLHCETCRCNE